MDQRESRIISRAELHGHAAGKTRSDNSRSRRRRSQKVRAILAAGAVLGVGTMVTLAAWTDQELVTATFAASVFETESRTEANPTYASNTVAPGATLQFNAGAMSPSVSHYAWVDIRTTSVTNVAGAVALVNVSNDGGTLKDVLEYRAAKLASTSTSCNAAAFGGTPVYIAGAAGSYISATTVPGSPVSTAIGAAGTENRYCFEVRVRSDAANSYQGTTATVTWAFTATSAG